MKPSKLLIGGLVVGAGWWLATQFGVKSLDDLKKLIPHDSIASGSPNGSPVNPASNSPLSAPPAAVGGNTIRIASFNIQVFGTSKTQKPTVMDILARIVREFDVVAIQEIRATDQDLMPNFVELINSAGRHYDYVIGPRLGRTSSKEQYAFVFDAARIEVDRSQLYTVADPDDLLHREPLVGWFRVRGPPPGETFTFSLVNIHTDPDEVKQELDVLDDVYRVVRDDGRQEDDVIILGDLNVDDKNLGHLGQVSGITWVISGLPTNTRRTAQYDNIVFHGLATSEFTGRGGVFDFLRRYNLSQEEALEVSDHMPVWAEFSVYEGGQPGRIATLPGSEAR
jgi:endonuclease/exonuclease/phosphatase family metal-dependent hydrolase